MDIANPIQLRTGFKSWRNQERIRGPELGINHP